MVVRRPLALVSGSFQQIPDSDTIPAALLGLVPYPPVTLTDAATIATNAALGNHFRVTLAGNRTLGAPTNLIDGQRIMWEIKQDATGGRTLAYNSIFRFGTDLPSAVLTTVASKKDFLGGVYNLADNKIDVISFIRGY